MTFSFESAVFRVTSADPGINKFGTCFAVHRDGSGTYLLTCRHVLDDVGGAEKVRVAEFPAADVITDPAVPVDLAVLRVKGLDNAPLLVLSEVGATDTPVLISGFYQFGRDTYRISALNGRLGYVGGLEIRGRRERISTWDVQVEGDDRLKPGYSGAPVIDPTRNQVIAVVSHRLDDGRKGVAVDADALRLIWKDMPAGLICGADEEAPAGGFTPIADLLCDRRDEHNRFRDFFKKSCAECPEKPLFFIIPGDEYGCHASLVRRFAKTVIRDYVKKEYGVTADIEPYPVDWNIADDEDFCRDVLHEELLLAFTQEPDENDTIKSLCRRLQLNKNHVVLIEHSIYAEDWEKRRRISRRMLIWYLKEYWAGVACDADMPRFFIFFHVKYPKLDATGLFQRLSRPYRIKKRLAAELAEIKKAVEGVCRCLHFEELAGVTRTDVARWFDRHAKDVNVKTRDEIMKKLFKTGDTASMADVEAELSEIVQQRERQAVRR